MRDPVSASMVAALLGKYTFYHSFDCLFFILYSYLVLHSSLCSKSRRSCWHLSILRREAYFVSGRQRARKACLVIKNIGSPCPPELFHSGDR